MNLAHLAPVYHDQIPSRQPPQADGVANGAGRRSRRNSLTDNVTVKRIGELSPVEHFKEATDDLNRENSLNRRRSIIHNDDDGGDHED